MVNDKNRINWRQTFASAIVGAIIGGALTLLVNRQLNEWRHQRVAFDASCELEKELKRNQTAANDVLRYVNETIPVAFYKSNYAEEFDRHLRMIEGSSFNRTLFMARSQDVASLPGDSPKHVYTAYALMELVVS